MTYYLSAPLCASVVKLFRSPDQHMGPVEDDQDFDLAYSFFSAFINFTR